MSATRREAIYEALRNAGAGPRLAKELGKAIDDAIEGAGKKEILGAIADVRQRLERIEQKLDRAS